MIMMKLVGENNNVENKGEVEIEVEKKYESNFSFLMLKRIFDFAFSLIVLPFVGLIVLIFGVLIKLEDGGSMFYVQKRVGRNFKEFEIYKLRSMRMNAESKSGSVWAQVNDPRITKIGKIVRKYRIDELPQFINVIKGEMSIIGPRPERLDLTIKFNEEVPGFTDRLLVKPGITGLAQVSGGYDISPLEKLNFDRIYINNLGIYQDALIVLKTIRVIFTGEGAR